MLQASEAPEALVAQLLALLAEAAEAADRCGGAMAEEKNPAEEDVGWVVNLVLATLAEKHEADTLASKRLSEALRTALDNHSKASEACKGKPATPQHHGTASKAAPFAGGGRPDIGGDVWACWPVDGHWYRAKVLGFAPRDRVKVAWCAPLKEDSHDCVEISDLDAELFSELSSSSLIRVDASIRRPPPAELTQVPAENCWTQALRKVESHSRNFQELRRVGKQLDFHIDWGTCGEDATTEETSMWRYVPDDGCHIDIRSIPAIAGGRHGLSDAAKPICGGGGWWAVTGKEHSLLLQLDDVAEISHVGLWCANVGATPLEIEICDARSHFPEICAAEEPNEIDISSSQAPPILHHVSAGCGKSDDECHLFDVKGPSGNQSMKHILLRFRGIHNSHYIGVNRLRLYDGDHEVSYDVVAADSNVQEAKNVARRGGWWAVAGQEHFLALELAEGSATSITSIGIWCANLGATPKEMHIVSDLGWIEDLIDLLEKLASDGTRAMGPRARRLIESNAGLLIGIAHSNERLRWALMVRVWAGEAPKFPISKKDTLSRLQAQLFCEMCRSSQSSAQLPKNAISGMDWHSFKEKMPSLGETSIEVSSRLLWKAESHDPEWLGTGLYVPPGGKVCVCTDNPTEGWSVRVGAHTDDISCRDEWMRWPQVSLILPLADPNKMVSLSTPFGGNVYLVRSSKASQSLRATFSGNLLQQPVVSIAKGVDNAILTSAGGWVDCEGQKEKPMLCGAAETISAWRVEIEERAEALGSFAADCEKEVKTFEDQISSSTAAMSAELETLHSERALTARRADGLRMRREELLAQLHAVEERAKQH
eukprot:g32831.t2